MNRLLMLGLLLLFACSPESAVPGVDNELKIGVVAPLSGPLALFGQRYERGLSMALEDINAQGGILGRPVELVYEDSKCDSTQTLTSLHALKELHNVQAFIGPFCGTPVEITATFSGQHHIVGITPNNNYGKFSDHYFSTAGAVETEDKVLARHAFERIGTTAGILYFENMFGELHRQGFKQHFEALGGIVLEEESFNFATKDFKPSLLKLKDADVIFVVYSVAGDIFKQAGELGIKARIISQWGVENPTVIPVAGEYAEGLVYTFPKVTSASWFAEDFKTKYDQIPTAHSASSYDALFMLKQAFEDCGSTDGDCAAEQMRTMEYDGALGQYAFNEILWGPEKEYVIKTIRDGEFVMRYY
ncbi:MAG: ABC transporter substrate-binding protein [Candidatus Woesearchaeota archaeon]|nr:ABC transporter substrate-binding protein [Candidatus Woesearchaeota archaeon]MDP7197994.1 ABC transporter substrate-binding protein [Candidatus Woesearchaeota archaeon]MDP7466828.1 ABC transporter substrate-binding protein [Candidatus Woesearchaeota archaeon]MDP7648053.1 ABC transporter substrate-binding protein [Candidatus Woesearchaeota archaeon]